MSHKIDITQYNPIVESKRLNCELLIKVSNDSSDIRYFVFNDEVLVGWQPEEGFENIEDAKQCAMDSMLQHFKCVQLRQELDRRINCTICNSCTISNSKLQNILNDDGA